jgi:hypothetical protein
MTAHTSDALTIDELALALSDLSPNFVVASPASNLVDDIGLDSLTMLEVVLRIERLGHMRGPLPVELVESIETFADLDRVYRNNRGT